MNYINKIRNNPKKSVFFTLVGGYAVHWLGGVYENHLFRHATCQSIKTKSMEPIHCLQKPKKVTVFFNPAASKGKSSRLYKKNAEPVLHLSGCDVKVVRLEYEGEAKQLMSVIEDVDMIVAAGGDGTVNEIITGLLRRPDAYKFKTLPIGVIPLGKTNSISQLLCDEADEKKQAQWIVKAVSDLFSGKQRQMDVMKIESENGKTAFALTDIRWGSYRDAQSKRNKYWIFGPWRSYASHLFSSFSSQTFENRQFDISYNTSLPVLEPKIDSSPISSPQQTFTALPTTTITKLFSWFMPSNDSGSTKSLVQKTTSGSGNDISDESISESALVAEPIFNKEKKDKQSIEFIASINTSNNIKDRSKAAIKVTLENDSLSFVDFMKNGPTHLVKGRHEPVDLKEEFECSKFSLTPKNLPEDKETFFSIDNEGYEVMPCTVEILPNQITMVCS